MVTEVNVYATAAVCNTNYFCMPPEDILISIYA